MWSFENIPVWSIVLLFIAVSIALVFLVWDSRQRKRRLEGEAMFRRREEEIRVECLRRTTLRKEWLARNQPVLYCNTIDGITAVLLPEQFEYALIKTKIDSRNGDWGNPVLLVPIPGTLVFSTRQGKDVIAKAYQGSDYTCRCDIGMPSDLDHIMEEYKVKLVWKREIFVPFVNETLRSFREQHEIFYLPEHPRDLVRALIDKQAPENLQ